MVKLKCHECHHTWEWSYIKWLFKAPFHWIGFDHRTGYPRDFRKTKCPKCGTKSWIAHTK